MIKTLASVVMFASLLASPAFCQESAPATGAADGAPAAKKPAKPKLSPEELEAERLKKKSESLRVKWYTEEEKAFEDAKKYNLPVWVLYSDPETCAVCKELDKKIIHSRKFKAAKGLCVGYRSTSPLPKYKCDKGMPMGALVGPDGKFICNLSYSPAMKPEKYIEQITNARIKIQQGPDAPIMLDGKLIPPPPSK
ncbi:MAG: hypothetical protein Q4F30_03495 [Akkermansia sp.]|nr:hypothetical protein [Akkermansia sp.]